MGWSILLQADDVALRSLTAVEVAEHLSMVAGTDSYPGALPPCSSGPLTRLGSFHSSARATLPVTAGLPDPVPGLRARFVPSSSGMISASELSRMLSRGLRPSLPSTSGSVSSVWQLYADSLSSRMEWVDVASGMLSLLDCSAPRGVPVGNHVDGLLKCGSLMTPGEVLLSWGGNLLSCGEAS